MLPRRAVVTRTTTKAFFAFCIFLAASAGILFAHSSSVSAAPPPFLTNYQLNDRSEDIRSLQQILNAEGNIVAQSGPGSPGNETSIFGLHTFRALKNFQSAHGLPTTGFFGPLTRAFINAGTSTSTSPQNTSSTVSSAATTTTPSTTPPFSTPLPGYAPGQIIFIGGSSAPPSAPISTPDTTPPSVSLTAPAASSTLSGSSVTLTATSSDNVGVAGVQFKVDGTNIGASGTTSPYSITWNSTSVSDGSHTIAAVAHDAASNYATSTVSVTVRNTPPVISAIASSTAQTTATITWTTDEPATSQVNFGLTTSYGSASSSGALVTSHSITLTALATSTIYHFYIQSVDGQGNVATSGDASFMTQYPIETHELIIGGHSYAFGDGSTGVGTDNGGLGASFNAAGSGFILHQDGYPGADSTYIRGKIVGNTYYKTHAVFLWAGGNDIGDPNRVMADYAAIIAWIGHPYFVILYEPTKTYTDGTGGTSVDPNRAPTDFLNALYASTYPGHVVDWTTPLGTVPGHILPAALRADPHLNDAGYAAIYPYALSVLNSVIASYPVDTVPDAFSFTGVVGQMTSSQSVSNTVRISGLNAAAPISIVGGEYQIDGGSWVTSSGTIKNGANVAIRNTNSGSLGVTTTATLTIGGVSSNFTSTTVTSANLVTNGNFASGSNWSLTGATISGGQLVFSSSAYGSAVQYAGGMTAGKTYVAIWTISGYSLGSAAFEITGTTNASGLARSANGTYNEIIVAPTSPTNFRVYCGLANNTMNVTNVQLYQVN